MRPVTFVLIAALAATAAPPVFAQAPAPSAPGQTTPPDKIDPEPIAPGSPAPADPAPERPNFAQPPAGDAIGIPARVWAVRIAGGWEADGKRGFSRVIGSFEGEKQKLVVQWLAEPDGRVIESKELEDEEAAKVTFGDMRADPEDRGGVTVFIDTLRDADGLSDTWVLVIGGPGEARFGPATN